MNARRLAAIMALMLACGRAPAPPNSGVPVEGASAASSTRSPAPIREAQADAANDHTNDHATSTVSSAADADTPASTTATPASTTDTPASTTTTPEDTLTATSTTTSAATPRACAHGERLDRGCSCDDGVACFDICCAAGSGCAHPAKPGGPSACMLQPKPSPRACTDGEALASGCACGGTRCMDLCCVGSACSHHSSPDGGYPKCVRIPKRP